VGYFADLRGLVTQAAQQVGAAARPTLHPYSQVPARPRGVALRDLTRRSTSQLLLLQHVYAWCTGAFFLPNQAKSSAMCHCSLSGSSLLRGRSVIMQRGLGAFDMGLWPKGTARRRSAGTDDAGIWIPLALLF
jgi:hypothetical protein